MHIDLCIVSSDLNEIYVGLYPYVRKAWNKLGIKTILILVANFVPTNLMEYIDDIILFKPIENIHTAFQAQTIRLLYPSLIIDKNILISDIDIIPLSKKYFIDNIKNIPNNTHVVFRNSYIQQNMYAACYHLSHTNIWKKIFNISNMDDIVNTIKKWYNIRYTGKKNCEGWFTDQQMLFKYINHNVYDNMIIMDDSAMKFNRLDKRKKQFITNNRNIIINNVADGVYTDFHVIRPFYKYINLIDTIIDSVNI